MSTVDSAVERPLPAPDEATARYWEAARERRLMFPFCTTCERWFHPVSLTCPNGHDTSEYRELSGRGTVYTFTTVREKTTVGLEPPYVVAIVRLDEQDDLCLVANLAGADGAEATVGMPVEVTYEDISPDCMLPQFTRSKGA